MAWLARGGATARGVASRVPEVALCRPSARWCAAAAGLSSSSSSSTWASQPLVSPRRRPNQRGLASAPSDASLPSAAAAVAVSKPPEELYMRELPSTCIDWNTDGERACCPRFRSRLPPPPDSKGCPLRRAATTTIRCLPACAIVLAAADLPVSAPFSFLLPSPLRAASAATALPPSLSTESRRPPPLSRGPCGRHPRVLLPLGGAVHHPG
jgi:hypothetical protein